MPDMLGMINLGVSTVMAIGLAWNGRRLGKLDDLQDKLETMVQKSVDSRFARHEERLNGHDTRLARGDGTFDQQAEKRHGLELMIEQRFAELTRTISKECASTESVEKIGEKVGQMAERFSAMEAAVARDIEQSKQRGPR